MSLTASQIIEADDKPKPTKVSVPEWGGDGHVYLCVMGGDGRDGWEGAQMKQVGGEVKVDLQASRRAQLLVRCLCDEKGKLLFTKNQVGIVATKNHIVLARLMKVALEINHLKDDSVEELEKNSEAAQSGGNGTGSPGSADAQ